MADLMIDDLTVEYASGGYVVRPIENLSLEVSSGELVLLLGPSGCGKTTLFSVLAGILQPASGSVRFRDAVVNDLGGSALTNYRRSTVGIVFQAFNLFPHMRVLDNVTLAPRKALGLPRARAEEEARALLGRFGLADKALEYPDRLSGGQQQRTAIVRALALRPRLMLLDEVTSALDPELVAEVLDVIRELAVAGMTMLIATHEMSFARDIASRVCFLDAGVILEQGSPAQIFSSPQEPRTRQFLDRIIEAGRL